MTTDALRPQSLAEFSGQPNVVQQLSLVLGAARKSHSTPDHILLAGPAGLGKTTLSLIIGVELDAPVQLVTAPSVKSAEDMTAILLNVEEGSVLFFDEIHRLRGAVAELLYMAMEDGRIDVRVGSGRESVIIPVRIPSFTLVGATTHAGMLPAPLRDRFGLVATLELYSTEDLTRVVQRSFDKQGVRVGEDAAREVALRSRGTPRIANRLVRRVRDFAIVNDVESVTNEQVDQVLAVYEVDSLGLDRLDREVLHALVVTFEGSPTSLATIAAATGTTEVTIEEMVEPYLIHKGLITRTPRGRVATQAAVAHLAS